MLQPCIHEVCFKDHFTGVGFLDGALVSGGVSFAKISVHHFNDYICTSGTTTAMFVMRVNITIIQIVD